MKTLLIILLLSLLLAGCTTSTAYGPCVGIADEKDTKLVYKVSAWNLLMGVFFWEIVIPPIVVIADEVQCPIGKK